ncbi:WD-40 repeat-containing protein [Cyclospora cayetanensis]|uniref:WD-40 repeat-containing protein n=1 Tax=Cyclospora cayetanensis TaxID=88456 RepID=A0A1D3CTI0_9EIME|nr:WD-40 repeat-containing protein [Cyclospora cayetanensis]
MPPSCATVSVRLLRLVTAFFVLEALRSFLPLSEVAFQKRVLENVFLGFFEGGRRARAPRGVRGKGKEGILLNWRESSVLALELLNVFCFFRGSADFAVDGSLLLIAAVGGAEGGSAKLLIVDLKAGSVARVYDCPEGGVSSVRFVANSTAECLLGGGEGESAFSVQGILFACGVYWKIDSFWPIPSPHLLPFCPSMPVPVASETADPFLWERTAFWRDIPSLTGAEGLLAHPRERLFLASCTNGAVFLFDMKELHPLASMQCNNPRPCIAFDLDGLVFAVARSPTHVHLVNSELTDLSLCFSPDGEVIAVATNRQQLLLVNAFEGHTMAELCEAVPDDPPSAWLCTPSFSGNSLLLFWSKDTSLYVFLAGAVAALWQPAQQSTVVLTKGVVGVGRDPSEQCEGSRKAL